MKKILLASLLPAIVGCAGVEPDQAAIAIEEFRAANYDVARQHIERAVDESPEDPDLQAWAELIHHAARIDDARRYVFQGQEQKAITILEDLIHEYGPSETAKSWLDKAKLELCKRKSFLGRDLLDADKLDAAEIQYKEALALWPGYEFAENGLKRIAKLRQRALAKADRNYSEGLRAKEDLRRPKVDYNATASLDSDPHHPGARRLQKTAERELAESRRKLAKTLFDQHSWAAAARRYEQAAKLAKDAGLDWFKDAERLSAEMKVEARADGMFVEAALLINKAKFDEARKTLDKAVKLTKHDLVRANVLEIRLSHKRTEVELQRALELKADGRYDEALDLLRDVAKRSPYSTAAGHIETILEIQTRSEQLYEKAEALEKQGKHDEARSLWRELREINPRFKDGIAGKKLGS